MLVCINCLVLQHYVFHGHNINSCRYGVVLCYSVLTVLCYSIKFFMATILTTVAIVLCCAVLCCTVLYCLVLQLWCCVNCIVLCCVVLYCLVLQHHVLHGHNCSYGVVLFCINCLVLQHNVFHSHNTNNCSYSVVLYYTVLCYSIRFSWSQY